MIATALPRPGLDGALRGSTAGCIRLYQRWLSPRKGFCCAYRHRTGLCSCSEYARRLVLRRGILALAHGLPRQFARCRRAYAAIQAEAEEGDREAADGTGARRRERGGSALEWASSSCDILSGLGECAPCDCSW